VIIVPNFKNYKMHSTLKRIQVLKKEEGKKEYFPWHKKHTSSIIGIILAIGSNKI
jgi:hypothetical protein